MPSVHRVVVPALLAVLMLVCAAAASPSSATPRRVLFLTLSGHGTVTSVPRGVACPKKCRVFFNKDQLVRLVSHPAAGWMLEDWAGSCTGRTSVCAFNLTSSHDCAGPMCQIGAFGVRVTFARASSS